MLWKNKTEKVPTTKKNLSRVELSSTMQWKCCMKYFTLILFVKVRRKI